MKLAILLLWCMTATAQEWPTKPVTLIVPATSGGAPDITARLLTARLSAKLGQQFIVDNRVGAAGAIGGAAVAKAQPDGYTYLFGSTSSISMNRLTLPSLGYDPVRDFAPVVNIGISPMMVAVSAELPVKTLPELIALAKQQPGRLNFATAGSRNIPHVTGELFASMAQIQLVHIPYKSGPLANADVGSGRVQIMVDGIPPLAPLIANGKLRPIATASAQRLPGLENIPAVAETLPGFEINGWFAIMAPAGVPQNIVERFNREVNVILKEPATIARLRELGTYPVGGSPEDLRKFIERDFANLEKAVAAAKLQKE
jgi:tripartite-type tricarboxylate transporter receptor subunit TctC